MSNHSILVVIAVLLVGLVSVAMSMAVSLKQIHRTLYSILDEIRRKK